MAARKRKKKVDPKDVLFKQHGAVLSFDRGGEVWRLAVEEVFGSEHRLGEGLDELLESAAKEVAKRG